MVGWAEAGAGNAVAAKRTPKPVGNALKKIVGSSRSDRRYGDRDRRGSRQTLQLTKAEQTALFGLSLLALFPVREIIAY